MTCSSSLFELLHKHLTNHYVIFIFEDSTEHNRYTISLCFYIPVTVIISLLATHIYFLLFTVSTKVKQSVNKSCITHILQVLCCKMSESVFLQPHTAQGTAEWLTLSCRTATIVATL
jgi:hypothetical protein